MSAEQRESGARPLDGAGIEAGRVIRDQSSVSRPGGDWSPSVQRVLAALVDSGMSEVPIPLGIDDDGREMLSFIEGEDQGWPLLPGIQSLEGARALGGLTRKLRGALQRYEIPADAAWQGRTTAVASGEIVQHGDLGPWNLLWQDGGSRIVGVLDWELAEPEDPDYDLGFLAWHTTPAMDDDRAALRGFVGQLDRAARLRAFAAGAGMPLQAVASAILRSQLGFAQKVNTRGRHAGGGRWRQLLELRLDESALSDYLWTKTWLSAETGIE
jgi:hypothetical protein